MITDTPALFARVVESLLGNAFICAYSDEDAFQYLNDPTYAAAVDGYVRRIGRTLIVTGDKQTFYIAFIDVDSHDRRMAIKKQFREVLNHIAPLTSLLSLIQSAQQSPAPIGPGSILRQGELLLQIENTLALKEDLALLTRGDFFRTSRTSIRDQIAHVLDKLCEHGYLRRNTATGSEYTALGRWSYFYEVLEFINTHENTGDDNDESAEQASLL